MHIRANKKASRGKPFVCIEILLRHCIEQFNLRLIALAIEFQNLLIFLVVLHVGGIMRADGMELADARGKKLYGLDEISQIRFSHENTAVQLTYEEYLEHPLSHRAHALLHTDLNAWDIKM